MKVYTNDNMELKEDISNGTPEKIMCVGSTNLHCCMTKIICQKGKLQKFTSELF